MNGHGGMITMVLIGLDWRGGGDGRGLGAAYGWEELTLQWAGTRYTVSRLCSPSWYGICERALLLGGVCKRRREARARELLSSQSDGRVRGVQRQRPAAW